MKKFRNPTFFLFLVFFLGLQTYGQQSAEQIALEEKRKKIQLQIQQISKLLEQEIGEKRDVMEDMTVLDAKINQIQNLISVTNQQANLLSKQINRNQNQISTLRQELEILRNDYAALLQAAHKQRSKRNKILFLFSAEDFFQAYKRFQYTKQYADYQKQQGEKIKKATQELSELNKGLIEKRATKNKLVEANKTTRKQLDDDRKKQENLMASIQSNETKYKNEIANKKKESRKIDDQIQALIKAAIASSNKKSGSKNVSSFDLTPERKIIANNFKANKGNLPWPVERGVISQGFGVYADKLYPGIKHNNNGVTIATDRGAEVRAVFEGEVIAVETFKTGQRGIYLRHGDFVTMYFNLSEVFVTKGQKISSRQPIGKVFANEKNPSGRLKFYLYQNTTKLNPESWIAAR